MHSIYSDGEFSPAELVSIAKKNRVSVLSLTDHDTFVGIDEFLEAADTEGIDAFPGIEITVLYRDFNVHLLAYFKSSETIDSEFRQRVEEMTSTRETRMRELVDRINQVVPAEFQGTIKFDNVKRAAEGVLARPHLAREMVRLNIVASTNQAFEKYLVEYNIEKKNLDIETALAFIRKSGGVPVLAHPGERTYSLYNPSKGRDYPDIPEMVDELKSMGLMGLECIYPYHEKIHIVDYFIDITKRHGLIVTGSRDFHGFSTYQPPRVLGTTKMDCDFFERFKEVWG